MRRQPGALEDAVIRVLSTGDWMSVAEVRAALDAGLAHTTVMTALVRLSEKGLVERVRRGHSYSYALRVAAAELPALRAALRMRRELDSRDERADVLANFVAALSPEDETVLRELLAGTDGEDRDEH